MFGPVMEHHLRAQEVGHAFGLRPVFEGVTLECRSGQIWGILGPNGSGKSTLLRILGGLLEPTWGEVRYIRGERAFSRSAILPWIGLVAPYANLYEEFSAYENLYWVLALRGQRPEPDRLAAVLERVGLARTWWQEPLRTYSSGMKQRVRLAAALVTEPSLLLLDEPTSNLDEAGVRQVRQILEEEASGGHIVLLATNIPEEASWCSHRLDLRAHRPRKRVVY